MVEHQADDIPQVSNPENLILTSPFTEEELKQAFFQMKHNKAPGSDGFLTEFYQIFWDVIKSDLMAFSLNFGIITLLPKCQEAVKIEQYRPICLLNVSFKIFTKIAANRINKVAEKVIRPFQTAFLPGRFILEGATVLHETLHEMHRKKLSGVIFKVDFEKTYDNVNVAVKVNSEIDRYFQTKKGLRQGDPLSPILFNLVCKQKILKILLCVFEQLSGLKINFHKSELYCFGKANDHVDQYSQILGCGVGKYSFKYLGIPINFRKLNNKDWRMVEKRFQKKLNSWKGKLLSYGGRLVLINSILSSLAMYMMSFFEIPKGIHKKLNFFRSGFFWQGKKYRLTKLGLLCFPKDQGGLGILNLEAQNTCLLSKWLYKLINEDGIWQQLLRKKYLKNKTIGEVFWKPGDSHFWSGLMKVKYQFMDLSTFQVHNGLQTRFWKNKWLGNFVLKEQYPSLFNIARKKHSSVAHVLSTNPLNISFRRALVGDKLMKWNDLVARVAFVQLDGHHDKAIWSLTKHGYFTVKSLYNFLVNQSALPLNKNLWKLKLPLKIKIFVWFLMKGVILTKDNLKKRNWNGDDGCCFCNKETIQRLFFDCHVARFVWRIFQVAFGLKPPSNLQAQLYGPSSYAEMIAGTYCTRFWSQLQKENGRNNLKWACRLLETVAFEHSAVDTSTRFRRSKPDHLAIDPHNPCLHGQIKPSGKRYCSLQASAAEGVAHAHGSRIG
ncbi:hypothetical protein U9M48_018450 [Paspalum notatum var. saurae]|uniref:Reverse transcriptase domain-containing protein n=1 Tax=Paspalum notatum var. saurae TaxID=547442 RepID=A0AAQ3TAR4_PASNO